VGGVERVVAAVVGAGAADKSAEQALVSRRILTRNHRSRVRTLPQEQPPPLRRVFPALLRTQQILLPLTRLTKMLARRQHLFRGFLQPNLGMVLRCRALPVEVATPVCLVLFLQPALQQLGRLPNKVAKN